MKRFRFPLDRVLKLRTDAERQRAKALSEALRAEEESRRVAEKTAADLAAVGEQSREQHGPVAKAGMLRTLRLVFEAAVEKADAAERTREQAVETRELENELWTRARMERRVLERLRERRLDAWEGERNRDEQREDDENALHSVRKT